MYQLILASQSPRRHQILLEAGYKVRIGLVKVSETFDKNLTLQAVVMALAQRKLDAFVAANKSLKGQEFLVIAADTLVGIDGRILGKPENPDNAAHFLRLLSGKTHQVMTSVAAHNMVTGETIVEVDSTDVSFRRLTDSEIQAYVDSGEAADKAGAYGIQGIAQKFVTTVKGSQLNVIGFPLEKFEKLLLKEGWQLERK